MHFLTMHQSATACKKFKDIVDKDRSVIDDINNLEEENLELTGVEDHALQYNQQNALQDTRQNDLDTADVTGVESQKTLTRQK